mmetsp:Transcript_3667/g.10613  ORF Transcript_3667/g.10613 Transcript_3667/m.10613 type:complete len:107 (+) Transcript_3667:189-509(+)
MQAALQVGRQLTRPVRQAVNQAQQTRTMSSGHSMEESIGEMNKWRNVTYLAIPGSIVFGAYTLLNEQHHGHHKAPDYPYLRIRSKTFPWGDCGLFEDCSHQDEEEE